MTLTKAKKTFPFLLLGSLLAFFPLVGCRKVTITPPPATPVPIVSGTSGVSPDPVGSFAAARKTFDAKCARCHAIGDSGGPTAGGPGPGGPGGGKRGPNLAKVGADPTHTRQWLMEYIREPKSKKADSKMPPFGNQMNDGELGPLADYLASLKGNG
jgi:mono/diheme cytochrome c family protein